VIAVKLISSNVGTVVQHISSDAVQPPQGLLQRDLVEFIAHRYRFAIKPNIPPNLEAQIPTLLFRSGKFTDQTGEYVVIQIGQLQNGDAVTALSTDIAERILADLITGLSEGMGFRYDGVEFRRSYSSGLVVEFDIDLEDKIRAFGKIEKILARAIPRENMPFKPKSLAFGYGEIGPMTQGGDLNMLENMDFTLQRRTGAPYSANRYFSNMPLPTDRHLEVLQEIENSLKG
jgi:hypothetical protein